jgi:hypothetical protein
MPCRHTGKVEGTALTILDPGTRGGRSAPQPGQFTPQESCSTHCIGGRVGLRAGLHGSEKSRATLDFELRAIQPVASRYTDYAIPAQ